MISSTIAALTPLPDTLAMVSCAAKAQTTWIDVILMCSFEDFTSLPSGKHTKSY